MRAAQRRRAREPYSIVLYDTMPGGTGYFPKLFANGADGLKAAAALALGRLEACDCAAAYDRCLRDFWNQCLHRLLNRFEAMAVLRRLAEGPALASPEAENERLESFLEQEFFDRRGHQGADRRARARFPTGSRGHRDAAPRRASRRRRGHKACRRDRRHVARAGSGKVGRSGV